MIRELYRDRNPGPVPIFSLYFNGQNGTLRTFRRGFDSCQGVQTISVSSKFGLGHQTFNLSNAGSNPVADANNGDKMFTLKSVASDHPLYIEPPKDAIEHVYSAIEYTVGNESNASSIVCYRTKDGLTHQAVSKDGCLVIRKSVKPFGK